ncbi:unnamed protein product, partial [Mesorhabditis belari]|uniref:Suppressor of Ty 6 homolog n=1 Tax=Mesorhabditis belari TaxID=2138241 RepID=A0AAF3J7L8_9BILA
MSDFIDQQAEESELSGDESDPVSEVEEPKSKKRKLGKKGKAKKNRVRISSDEEDEDEDDAEEEARAAEEFKGFIINEGSDEEEEGEEEDRSEKSKSGSEEELDDDDLALLDENLGPRKKRVVRPEDSDEDEDDRTRIQRKLFSHEDDDAASLPEARGPSARGEYDDDRRDYSGSEEEYDNFIVQDGRTSRRKVRRNLGIDTAACDEARDVFGVDDFNIDEFYNDDGEVEDVLDEEEEILDEEDREDSIIRSRALRKKLKKEENMMETFEPSELDRCFLSANDKKIVLEDRPERFNTRRTPVTEADDIELEAEARWIYTHAFDPYESAYKPVSSQDAIEISGIKDLRENEDLDPMQKEQDIRALGQRAKAAVLEVLKMIRLNSFEVPFIVFYRKECLEKCLTLDEVWRVYNWDEKWCNLKQRKQKLSDLMRRIQKYQTESELVTKRPLTDSDFFDVDGVETLEQLNDISAQFHMYHGNELNKLADWERLRQLELQQQEQKQQETFVSKFKKSSRTDQYTICLENGIGEVASKFGLTPRQFAENLEFGSSRHECTQVNSLPTTVAADYITSVFSSPDKVISGAIYMLAREFSRQPKVREVLRTKYRRFATMSCRPTKLGRQKIDEAHPLYKSRYLVNKPVSTISGDQFLSFDIGVRQELISIEFSSEANLLEDILREHPFQVDLYDSVTEEWNLLRKEVVRKAVSEFLVPEINKELHELLKEEAKASVLQSIRNFIYERILVGPYQKNQGAADHDKADDEDEDDDEENRLRVCSLCYVADRFEVSFGAIVNQDGAVLDYVRLPHFTKPSGPADGKNDKGSETARLKKDTMDRLGAFIAKRRPHVIVICGEDMDAKRFQNETSRLVSELLNTGKISSAPEVMIVENELAKVYSQSKMAASEFPEYPILLRQCVSLARYVADPLVEVAHLWNEDEDLFCLQMHSLQGELDKEEIKNAVALEFINRVNEVGVDPNRCLSFPHHQNLIQFICGLGPRKAYQLIKVLRWNNSILEARSKLVIICQMGPKVFMNCAGFMKINTSKVSEHTDKYVEILDGSRIHPETYEWARKMAVDALEFDDSGDPTAALEEILVTPEKLRDLDLDAFAEELHRQGFGNKSETLYDIRRELSKRYEDWRPPFGPPSDMQLFKMLTKESKNTLYIGKLVEAKVIRLSFKPVHQEQQSQREPIRLEDSNQWVCPWCCSIIFDSIAELYEHLDDGLCPGETTGIKVKLDNGLIGFISNKNIATDSKSFKNPLERVAIGRTIACRILQVEPLRFSCTLTCRSIDLRSEELIQFDEYFDFGLKTSDEKDDEKGKDRQAQQPQFVRRICSHPAFRNVSYREAEHELAAAEQGEAIIRPSTRSPFNLTLTWKVGENVYAHVDILEKDKTRPNEIGKTLQIGAETFEDLDEILARYVQPMVLYANEICSHKYFIPQVVHEDRSLVDAKLYEEKRLQPNRIPYVLTTSGDIPGKFLLSYLISAKPKHEYMTVTHEGIRFRSQFFMSMESLLAWFKKHFRDPPPSKLPTQQYQYR